MIIEINEIIMNCLGEHGQANSNKDDVYEYDYGRVRAAFCKTPYLLTSVPLLVSNYWSASWHVLD